MIDRPSLIGWASKALEAYLLQQLTFIPVDSYSSIRTPYEGEFGLWRGIVWLRASPVVSGTPDIIGM